MLYNAIRESLIKNSEQLICSEERAVNYGWLLEQSEGLAYKLKGQKYGIYCKDKLNCMVAILACLCAHKTAVLLCPEYGDTFNKAIMEKASIENFITDEDCEDINITTENFEIEEELNNIAFIIHTSGTTGSSKGVMLTQENVLENFKSKGEYFRADTSSTMLIYRPIYHTATVSGEFIASILEGANLRVLPSSTSLQYITQTIQKYQITHVMGTPTILNNLVRSNRNKEKFKSIKAISVSGECLSERITNVIKEGFANAEIYHCYGMTEAGPRVANLPPNLFGKDFCCVGYPFQGVSIKIVNEENQEITSPRQIGQLVINGKGIMQGYYRDRAATDQVLKKGWYSTGDCGYKDENGLYYVTGRKDQMHIRAGVNVWLRDVEEALLRNEKVESVYVYLTLEEPKRIVAQVVSKKLTIQELWGWCLKNMAKTVLPDYMEIVNELQISECGKRRKNIHVE